MDLIMTAWQRGNRLEGGEVLQLPANYGGHGGATFWQWTPTLQTVDSDTRANPFLPQSNVLIPVVWEEYVLSPAEVEAINQAALIQVPEQQPAYFGTPGTASLSPLGG